MAPLPDQRRGQRLSPRSSLSLAGGLAMSLLAGLFTARVEAWSAAEVPDLAWSTHGLMIDAGSKGSRMHVFEWDPRATDQLPPPLSFPSSKPLWTQRMSPGISTFGSHPQDVEAAMLPLMDFAKEALKEHSDRWHSFPVFWRATGGMRELPHSQRFAIVDEVQKFLGGDLCPFYFEKEYARVLSGEEEGIFGWTAVNFIKDTLQLSGRGYGTSLPSTSFGALDMGGASTQISFFNPDHEIMANLFKLHLGGHKHYNLYTHSFLYYGSTSARVRLKSHIATMALLDEDEEEEGDGSGRALSVGEGRGRRLQTMKEKDLPYSKPLEFSQSQRRKLGVGIADPTEVLKSDEDVQDLMQQYGGSATQVVDVCLPSGFPGAYFVETSSGKPRLIELIPPPDKDNRLRSRHRRSLKSKHSKGDGKKDKKDKKLEKAEKKQEKEEEKEDKLTYGVGTPPSPYSPTTSTSSNATTPTVYNAGIAAVTPVASDAGEHDTGFAACYPNAKWLLNLEYNGWCHYAHKGDCSYAGIYQPPLPTGNHSGFFAFSGYYDAWILTGLPSYTTLAEFRDKAEDICSMNYTELKAWNEFLGKPIKKKEIDSALHMACFQLSYAFTLLHDGYGFALDHPLTFVDDIDGFKIGWALGAMLFEINTLPWTYTGPGAKDAYHDFDKVLKKDFGVDPALHHAPLDTDVDGLHSSSANSNSNNEQVSLAAKGTWGVNFGSTEHSTGGRGATREETRSSSSSSNSGVSFRNGMDALAALALVAAAVVIQRLRQTVAASSATSSVAGGGGGGGAEGKRMALNGGGGGPKYNSYGTGGR